MRQPVCSLFRATALVSLAVLTACSGSDPIDVQASIQGTPREGQTLTVSLGGESPPAGATVTYQWERCGAEGEACASIPGETGTEHLLGAADVGSTLQVLVSVKDGERSGEARAPRTSVILPLAPSQVSAPTISGEARGGSTLTGSPGTWASSGALTYTYRWLRCDASGEGCNAVSGATASTYVPVAADLGATLRLEVTATNAGGSGTARSAATAPVVGVLLNAALPTLSGNARITQSLTGTQGTWQAVPDATYAYQWERCDAGGDACTDIPGATQASYFLAAEELGGTVRLRVTASSPIGTVSARSAPSAVVTLPCDTPLSQGPRSPTVAANVSGTVAWSQPSSVSLDDGVATTATLRRGDVTEALVLKGWGFNLPPYAAIRGIRVDVKRSASVEEAVMDHLVMLDSPVSQYSNRPSSEPWSASPGIATYGGPNDLWQTSELSPTIINDPSFGVILSARHSGTGGPVEARVDSVRVTIFYTDASRVGPASPSLVQDDASIGTVAWTNPQAAAEHDGTFATVSNLARNQITHYLKATGFGLSLPAGKIPSGLFVEVERAGSTTGFADYGVWRVKGGVVSGRFTSRPLWSTEPVYAGYGDAVTTVGVLTAADVADPGFGAAFNVTRTTNVTPNEARVDHIRMSVLYDPVQREVSALPAQATSTPRTRSWLATDDVLLDDGLFALIQGMIDNEVSDDLRTTGYGFSIPEGARITGLRLDIKRESLSAVGLVDGRVRLMVGDQPLEEDRGRPEVWAGLETVPYGGVADGWGRTWTPAEVNAPGFGAALSTRYASQSGNDHPRVDHMAMTVFYCPP
ncbi:hypothetical protein [Hyalangium gracile]|uniref:hypothetical protein n=1 Tax=Hyalangium gracile TaxID=394092 RepID=UPI001CCE2916|nr:hypothetical protein [Hyalangium gracile]